MVDDLLWQVWTLAMRMLSMSDPKHREVRLWQPPVRLCNVPQMLECWDGLTFLISPRCHSLSYDGSLEPHEVSMLQIQWSYWAWHMWGHQGQGCLWQIRGLSSCQMCQDQIVDWGLAEELPNWPNCQKAPQLNQDTLDFTRTICIYYFQLFWFIFLSDQTITLKPIVVSPVLTRAVITLNADLATLDSEYNKLSIHVAEGERQNHSQTWLSKDTKGRNWITHEPLYIYIYIL